MEIPLLKDSLIIFGLSIAVLLTCHKLRIPTLVGFLITGIIAGPHGFKWISGVDDVRILSEIGIIFLLFAVGLEFSIKKIFENKRYFFIAGPLQVLLTVVGGFLAGKFWGRPPEESLFLGFLLSLSSTAIVMKTLQERGENNTPHGRFTLGILIFQDVMIVPMILLIPFLGKEPSSFNIHFFWSLGKGFLILAFTFFSAVRLVPPLLHQVAKTHNRELFLLTVLAICFSVAFIASNAGLSLALGAFLAGLIVSESEEYSQQAIGNILPFQDIFTSFFFVSIGMLLDLDFFFEYPAEILLVTFGIFVLKIGIVVCTAFFVGLPIRPSILSGFALAQVGEFSFVLAMSGMKAGIGNEHLHQLFIAVAILTMGLTPSMMAFSHSVLLWILRLPVPILRKIDLRSTLPFLENQLKNHVIIVGFGFAGQNLARATREAKVSYVAIDMNPEIVREQKRKGEPITFGDATRGVVLKHAGIQQANVIAVVVNDPIATLRIIELARRLNPTLYIIARTRYLQEMQPLYQLGANDVVPDELGSSIEIYTRVLSRYQVSPDRIDQLVEALRVEGYALLHPRYVEATLFSDLKEYLGEVLVRTLTVYPHSILVGKSLKESHLRKEWGLTVLVIKRENYPIYNIDANTILQANDQLVVIGTKERLSEAEPLFHP